MTYTVGRTAGNPLFDLRQTIGQAWVDGAPIDPGLLAAHDVGAGLSGRLLEDVLVQREIGRPPPASAGRSPPREAAGVPASAWRRACATWGDVSLRRVVAPERLEKRLQVVGAPNRARWHPSPPKRSL
jgi:hypothetical protein